LILFEKLRWCLGSLYTYRGVCLLVHDLRYLSYTNILNTTFDKNYFTK